VVNLNLLKEEVKLYSCTPRNFSVSIREELKRTDTIFWPGCLLVKRCGGNCACCLHNCNECQCVPRKVTKKYHEVRTSFSTQFLWDVFFPNNKRMNLKYSGDYNPVPVLEIQASHLEGVPMFLFSLLRAFHLRHKH
jgi:hypothetical protein